MQRSRRVTLKVVQNSWHGKSRQRKRINGEEMRHLRPRCPVHAHLQIRGWHEVQEASSAQRYGLCPVMPGSRSPVAR